MKKTRNTPQGCIKIPRERANQIQGGCGGESKHIWLKLKTQCPRTFWFRAADAQSWDNPINEGYLSKQSGIMKSWKRKWVRLTKTDLFIFDSPTVGRRGD